MSRCVLEWDGESSPWTCRKPKRLCDGPPHCPEHLSERLDAAAKAAAEAYVAGAIGTVVESWETYSGQQRALARSVARAAIKAWLAGEK